MDAVKPLRGIVVFGGGTATNSLVDVFENLRRSRNCELQYVIPISDNGGSSSELIRVFGGPGIGDVRSRLVRLIPPADTDAERVALKSIFNHRLSADPNAARSEWLDIVEGRHELWADMSSEKRELIRSIFNHMNMEIVKRARPSSVFNFAKASIGNLFLTGARLFTGSLESAIYLLSTICAVPSTVAALPAINSNFTHHISAGLEDGSQITGQNAISHPSAPTSLPDIATVTAESPSTLPFDPLSKRDSNFSPSPLPNPFQDRLRETEAHDRIEDATLPGSLPSLRKPYLSFTKEGSPHTNDLPSRISRIWYINPYGHEIYPVANPKVVTAISRSISVIYSIGSLYTSLIPSLVLRGVGRAIAALSPMHQKILILNSTLDRETGPSGGPLTATDFVRAIARACAETQGAADAIGGSVDGQVRRYVTHLLYLEGEGVPKVNKTELAALGVDCIRVYGRRVDGMLCYDEAGLVGALEAVVGKAEMVRSRRNTSGQ
ncbi:UPF0052 domain protein [Xylaria bambusicola]|uniref:UPF0052 domain protein n=1 Tax=Xylaria bambusicola TaxID=326684 RepID=UPI00200813DF|nr:UPF0052 domain protein [Xylaria bambusicola]KAI0506338.1 UPF0052 domain protein [Xylaria bambusicola]